MRLFFALDGDTKFSEMDIKKFAKDAGDYIVCHTEALYHQLKGEQVLSGNDTGKIILCTDGEVSIRKPVFNIIFFTKVPKHISSNKQRDHVIVTASFE